MEATNYSYLPRWSDGLSCALICRTLAGIDPSTMSSRAYLDLIDYINYDSPFSLDFPSLPPYYHPVPQYQPQPPLSDLPSLSPPPVQPPSYMPYYPQVPQESYGYRPMYYPIQPYDLRPPLRAYDNRVRFVDGVAIILAVAYERSDDYEDSLALQEQIGRVNEGLSEETIKKNLKTSLIDVASKDKEGVEICAVCLNEYKVHETIRTLRCGHCYHANCIKEWLLQKNVHPTCKAKALIT